VKEVCSGLILAKMHPDSLVIQHNFITFASYFKSMKILAVTFALTLMSLFIQAQSPADRQQYAPAQERIKEQPTQRKQSSQVETVRQVKKDRHTEKCCVRKSDSLNPRKRD
jgi:hypothetical protein